MHRAARPPAAVFFLALLVLPAVGAGESAHAAGEPALPVNGLGVSLPDDWLLERWTGTDAEPPPLPDDWRSPHPLAPLYVRLLVPDAALDTPMRLEAVLRQMEERHLVPVLVLEPPVPAARTEAAGDIGFDLDRWLDRLQAWMLARPLGGALIQVMDDPFARLTPASAAYVFKRVSLLVRSISPSTPVAAGPATDPSQILALEDRSLRPYLDAVTLDARIDPQAGLAAARTTFTGRAIWIDGVEGDGRTFLRRAGEALGNGISLILAAPGAGPEATELAAWRRLLDPEAMVVPLAYPRVRGRDASGAELAPGSLIEIESASRGRHVVILDGPVPPVTLDLAGPLVALASLVDPLTLEATPAALPRPPEPAALLPGATARVELSPRSLPALVRLEGLTPPLPLPEVEEVRGRRELSVEEIVARHRQAQASQDRLLLTLVAEVTIAYHFNVASFNQTFDVTTKNRLYHDQGRTVFEEEEIYLNGARWVGTKPPDLPFILPERISEVPLDLRLDDRYLLRLEGRETVGERDAYVVGFDPLPTVETVYRGRIWIDSVSFHKLRMDVVVVNEQIPVISNALTQTFAPVEAAGRTWMLPERLDGQMVFTALGFNVALQRRLDYGGYLVNPEDVEERIASAFTSPHEILQETATGFQRLKKTRDDSGAWTAQAAGASQTGVSRLLVGGFAVSDDLDPGLPYAGVNYFNFNFRGTGDQFNVAWAGPFADILWSNPDLGGSRFILSLEGRVNPLTSGDKILAEGDGTIGDIEGERLEMSDQIVSGSLGRPLGSFHKLEAQADFRFLAFDRADETDPAYTVPSDTTEGALILSWVYNRAGFRLETNLEWVRRQDWSFWGNADGSDWEPTDRDYARRSLVLSKNFYVRKFDRFGFRASLLDGDDLDRFSRFEPGGFGASRISGFSSSGLRFDRGGIVDLNYAVGLTGRTRLEFEVTHGRFLNREDFGDSVQHATGASTAVSFSAPLNTYVRVRVGAGLDSSLEDLDPGGDLRVTVYRTFDRWFWQAKPEPEAIAKSPEPSGEEETAEETGKAAAPALAAPVEAVPGIPVPSFRLP